MSAIQELEARLNMETGRIRWVELQPFFARGQTIRVAPELDLVRVASAFAEDRAEQVGAWRGQGRVTEVNADDARHWYERDAELWAVVVAPWVLVQEVREH